jgi:sec-independent protein translocase protein TatA
VITGFFDISGGEILVILLVVFIIFGPDKIPEIARWFGKGMNEIKKATSEIQEEITRETGDLKKATSKIRDEIQKQTKEVTDAVSDPAPPPKQYSYNDDKQKEPQL